MIEENDSYDVVVTFLLFMDKLVSQRVCLSTIMCICTVHVIANE